MYRGFVAFHRKMTKWEWYHDVAVKVLFLHLLLSVNHSNQRWEGVEVYAGEMITSIQHLAESTGLSVQQVRTAMNKLQSTGEITVFTTNRYSKIRINNWQKYQLNNTTLTRVQHAFNMQPTPNNNDKNGKMLESEGDSIPPSLEEVKNYVLSKALNMSAEKFYAHYEANGWMMGASKMQNWPAAADKWALTEKEFNGNQISESDRDMDMSEDRIEYYRHNIPTIEDD